MEELELEGVKAITTARIPLVKCTFRTDDMSIGVQPSAPPPPFPPYTHTLFLDTLAAQRGLPLTHLLFFDCSTNAADR